jgi:hypothetical protein
MDQIYTPSDTKLKKKILLAQDAGAQDIWFIECHDSDLFPEGNSYTCNLTSLANQQS